jgi:type I restriction enzyme S subunit
MSEMKQNWEIKRLGDVVEFQRGLTYSKKDEVDFSDNVVLRSNNVDLFRNQLDFSELKYINSSIEIPENKKVKKGSLLICTANGSKRHLGKVALIDDDYNYAFGGFMGLINPKQKLDSKFLFYLMTSDNYKKFINELSDGANINNLKFGDLGQFEITLPPLPEQQRIVAILDEAFAAIAKAKANAEKNLKNARELFESYLQGVFENKGEDWEEKSLGDVCKISSKLIDPKISEYQNLIHIGAGNIESQKGTLIGLKTAKEENLISGKFLFDESMVLYSKIRPYLMKVVNCKFQGLCSADIYPLVPIKEKMTKNFLYHLLLTKNFTDYAILGSQRAGMPKVNREHLFAFKFELPPIKEQQIIIQKLDALSAETKKLEAIYQQKINDLEELKKSVLQKAFSGELGTNIRVE